MASISSAPATLALCLVAALLIDDLVCPTTGTAVGGGGSDRSGLSWRKPGFCGNMDCPEYTVWQRSFEFEVREYREAVWVAVNVSEVRFELAIKAGTPILSQYFWGANKEGLRLKETVPLVVHYRLDAHPHTGERQNFTLFWFLPYNYHEEPPEPTQPSVWIYRNPNATMFVRMFPHRAQEWRVIEETRGLIDALNHAGHDYEPSGVLVAAYSHPSKHHPSAHGHRYHHSEVWMHGTFNKTASN